jgi:hypothetical protein
MEGKDMLAEREVIKRAKIAYGQALQTAGGFAIVRVLLLQRTESFTNRVHTAEKDELTSWAKHCIISLLCC